MPSLRHRKSTKTYSKLVERQKFINDMYKEMMSLDGINTNDKTIEQMKKNKSKNIIITIFTTLKNIFRKWLKRK